MLYLFNVLFLYINYNNNMLHITPLVFHGMIMHVASYNIIHKSNKIAIHLSLPTLSPINNNYQETESICVNSDWIPLRDIYSTYTSVKDATSDMHIWGNITERGIFHRNSLTSSPSYMSTVSFKICSEFVEQNTSVKIVKIIYIFLIHCKGSTKDLKLLP